MGQKHTPCGEYDENDSNSKSDYTVCHLLDRSRSFKKSDPSTKITSSNFDLGPSQGAKCNFYQKCYNFVHVS